MTVAGHRAIRGAIKLKWSSGWPLVNMTDVFIVGREISTDRAEGRPGGDTGEDRKPQARAEALADNAANTLVSDFWPPEL